MKVFLGSATESLDDLREIEAWLQALEIDTLSWDMTGLFPPGSYPLERLIEISQDVDAAVFVFGEDDRTWYRGNEVRQPRDNLLLEYGLFSGTVGRDRAVICLKGAAKLASDLGGITIVPLEASGRRASSRRALEKWIQQLNERPERSESLAGPWYSTWETKSRATKPWLLEEVRIERKSRFAYKFETADPKCERQWTAFARHVLRDYLILEGASIRAGATSSGLGILGIHPQGGILYGFWMGPDREGRTTGGGWVLARKKADLAEGKQLLKRR